MFVVATYHCARYFLVSMTGLHPFKTRRVGLLTAVIVGSIPNQSRHVSRILMKGFAVIGGYMKPFNCSHLCVFTQPSVGIY